MNRLALPLVAGLALIPAFASAQDAPEATEARPVPSPAAEPASDLVSAPFALDLIAACRALRSFATQFDERRQHAPDAPQAVPSSLRERCMDGSRPTLNDGELQGSSPTALQDGLRRWTTEIEAAAVRETTEARLCAQLSRRRLAAVGTSDEVGLRRPTNAALSGANEAIHNRLVQQAERCEQQPSTRPGSPNPESLLLLDAYLEAAGSAGRLSVVPERLRGALEERDGLPVDGLRGNLAAMAPSGVEASEDVADELGGLLSTVLEGLARFLASRAEAEVQAFVVERLRDELCTPEEASGSYENAVRPEALSARLLVNTCSFLGDGSFTFSATFGRSFQAAVLADLLSAPAAGIDLLGLYLELGEGEPDQGQARVAQLTLTMALAILEAADPADVLGRIADQAEDWEDANVFVTVLRVSARVAEAAARTEDHTRISEEDFEALLGLGLGDLSTADARVARRLVRNLASLVREVRTPAAAEAVQAAAAEEGGEAGGDTVSGRPGLRPSDAERIGRIVQASVRVLDDVLALAHSHGASDETTLPRRVPRWFTRSLRDLVSGSPARMVRASLRFLRHGLQALDVNMPDGVIRVLALGAELASVEDAEAAAAVFDEFSAPVGSWRLKQQRPLISFTGMLGVWGGGEYAFGTSNTTGEGGGAIGLIGMVGLDVTGQIDRTVSMGAFFSLLDVGALVVASGASPDATDEDAGNTSIDVSPVQFVAPGVFYRVGFPDLPLVGGLGVSVLPWGRSVRWVDAQGDEQSELVPVLRVQAWLAVDITILPF